MTAKSDSPPDKSLRQLLLDVRHELGERMGYAESVAILERIDAALAVPPTAPKGSDAALIAKLEGAEPIESPQQHFVLVPITLAERDNIVATLKLWWWPAAQRNQTSAPSSIAATGETPRTDAISNSVWSGTNATDLQAYNAMSDHARQLERELAVCYEHIQRDDKEILSLHARLAAHRPPIAALVPAEPTYEMKVAGSEEGVRQEAAGERDAELIYRAMVAAAPPSPLAAPQVGVPYLHNGGDGVDGHYCIGRKHQGGYLEFWNKGKWCSAGEVFLLDGPSVS